MSSCNVKISLTSTLSLDLFSTLKQLEDQHMTTHGFHNVRVKLSVKLWLIMIFRMISNIGHLPIANIILGASLYDMYR